MAQPITNKDTSEDAFNYQIKRLHELIGAVSTGMSEVEASWYLVLACMMADTPRAQVEAVFSLMESSAAQRLMVCRVADATYKPDKAKRPHKTRRLIGRLIAETNDLSGIRNAAAHAAIAYESEAGIKRSINVHKPNKLAGKAFKEIESALTKAAESAFELEKRLDHLIRSISPLTEVPKEKLEALRKLGIPFPSALSVRPSLPDDP